MNPIKTISISMAVAIAFSPMMLAGCGKSQKQGKPEDELNKKLMEIVASMQSTKVPTKSNLTPALAAKVTHEVSMQSLATFPRGQDLPKEPKAMAALNEQIREKSEQIYTKYGTSSGETMRYISDLTPKDRELYNQELTKLFLEQAKKNVPEQPAAAVTPPAEVLAQPTAAVAPAQSAPAKPRPATKKSAKK